MRVRVNARYVYFPTLMDRCSPCKGNVLAEGREVKVVNLPNAPKANVMGQCYVADPVSGNFLCMVNCNSLVRPDEWAAACAAGRWVVRLPRGGYIGVGRAVERIEDAVRYDRPTAVRHAQNCLGNVQVV